MKNALKMLGALTLIPLFAQAEISDVQITKTFDGKQASCSRPSDAGRTAYTPSSFSVIAEEGNIIVQVGLAGLLCQSIQTAANAAPVQQWALASALQPVERQIPGRRSNATVKITLRDAKAVLTALEVTRGRSRVRPVGSLPVSSDSVQSFDFKVKGASLFTAEQSAQLTAGAPIRMSAQFFVAAIVYTQVGDQAPVNQGLRSGGAFNINFTVTQDAAKNLIVTDASMF